MSDKDRIFAHKQTIVVLRHKLAEMHDVNDELRKQLAELSRTTGSQLPKFVTSWGGNLWQNYSRNQPRVNFNIQI